MVSALDYLAMAGFEGACRVDGLAPGHRAGRLHGHSYQARLRTPGADLALPFAGAETELLSERLEGALEPLNYRLLNDVVALPTDENLARWIRARLALTGPLTVGVRSTADQGVDLDRDDHAHLWRSFRFEAAHRLPNVPEGHPCGRLHGHGFEVILHADQDLAGSPMGLDYDELERHWLPLRERLHQRCLNDLEGLANPTSEMLCGWIWQQLKPQLPELSWVTVYETHSAGCHYDGSHYRIWKELRFESALRHGRAPTGDARGGLFGHSYILRLHLTAPLDQVLGWTVDYGDVKRLFQPVYERLDHHLLNDLPGLPDADTASLLHWIRAQMSGRLAALDRVDLYEQPGRGASLCWGDIGPALPL